MTKMFGTMSGEELQNQFSRFQKEIEADFESGSKMVMISKSTFVLWCQSSKTS